MALVGGLLAAAGLLFILTRRSPDLLDIATPFCEANGWDIDRGPDSCKAFFWTSGGDVIHLASNPARTFVKPTTGGGSTPLGGLTTAYRAFPTDPTDVLGSPDGSWVLWLRDARQIVATRVDGSRQVVFPKRTEPPGKLVWRSNSRSFLELDSTSPTSGFDTVRFHDLDAPHSSRTLSVPKATIPKLGAWPDAHLVVGDRLVVLRDGWREPPGPRIVSEVRLSLGVPLLCEFHINMPKEGHLEDAACSPTGDRVAWQLGSTHQSSMPKRVYDILPFLKRPLPTKMTSLWVSRIDGSEMREIGWVSTPDRGPIPHMISDLIWLPDDRRLSFFYGRPDDTGKWKSTLYTVPTR